MHVISHIIRWNSRNISTIDKLINQLCSSCDTDKYIAPLGSIVLLLMGDMKFFLCTYDIFYTDCIQDHNHLSKSGIFGVNFSICITLEVFLNFKASAVNSSFYFIFRIKSSKPIVVRVNHYNGTKHPLQFFSTLGELPILCDSLKTNLRIFPFILICLLLAFLW